MTRKDLVLGPQRRGTQLTLWRKEGRREERKNREGCLEAVAGF